MTAGIASQFFVRSTAAFVLTAMTFAPVGHAAQVTINFSCTILFANQGARTSYAEYTGSLTHGFSGSGPEPHTANISTLFNNGFK